MQLRRIQVEARALQAVEAVLAGGRVEDDLIECKADWPNESKVRQLAAHANAARGEPIIWLIGVDEKSHQVTKHRDVDPANWWAMMSKRFDEVIPEMLHVTVHVGEADTVAALAFTTDLPPYVITTGGEQPRVEREVPIRVATGTRSAHRRDLLRLLFPAMMVPQAFPIEVSAWTEWNITSEPEEPVVMLSATVFFEHSGVATVMLPAHQMWARLDFDFPSHLQVRMPIRPTGETPSVPFGIQQRRDGVVVSGSGSVAVSGSAAVDDEDLPMLKGVRSFR